MLLSLAAVGFGAMGAGSAAAGASAATERQDPPATDPGEDTAPASCEEVGCFVVLEVVGLIDPVTVRYVEEWLDQAHSTAGVRGIVLQLDSEGAAVPDDEFVDFAQKLVDSPVPVSVWVGPTGSKALGASAELVLALSDSSMAFDSTLGDIGHQRLSDDLVGDLAVTEPRLIDGTVDADRALEDGLIDRSNPVLVDFLGETDGFDTEVVTEDGQEVLQPVSVPTFAKLSLIDGLFHTVASRPVAYLLLAVAVGLLIFEFFTAGVGVAGLIGAGAALFAGYGLDVLPTRPWALALCLLAGVAFSVDVQSGLPRAWMFIGSVMWVVGSVFLFEGGTPLLALATGIIGMLVSMISGMPSMVRARFGTPTIGRAFMVGRSGTAESAVDPTGVVLVDGARWRARTNRLTPLEAGDEIVVGGIDGLELQVEPPEGAARDYRELRQQN